MTPLRLQRRGANFDFPPQLSSPCAKGAPAPSAQGRQFSLGRAARPCSPPLDPPLNQKLVLECSQYNNMRLAGAQTKYNTVLQDRAHIRVKHRVVPSGLG